MDIERVFNEQFGRVYGFYYRKTMQVALAEDLTSTSFLRFAERARSTEVRDPKKFLYGIVHNVWLEYLRDKYRSPEILMDMQTAEGTTAASSGATASYEDSNIVNYVQRLPDKQRQVIELRYVNNLAPSQIAEFLGKDGNYVKVTHQRALKSLRMLMEGEKL